MHYEVNYTMHYYQFNIGDYSKSTKHLTPLEDIAYRRMLDLHYDTEKPLPCEIASIARLIVMRENQEEIRQVLNEFWCETEEGWINKRASEDIDAYKEKSEKAKKSAEARWAKQKDSADNAKGMRTHSESNANHKPLTKNQEPNKDIVEQARLCLEYLNEVTGSKYKHSTKSHIQNITARISDGFTSDDIKMVVDAKSAEWGNDEKMCQYLRPSTLFSAKNFNGYLAAAKSKPNTDFRNPTKTQDYSKGW